MKRIIKIIFTYLLLGLLQLQAQQFFTQGNAAQLNATTFRLTEDLMTQKGMITNLYPLDLTQNFDLDFSANFGSRDGMGADGIAVIFSKICNPTLVEGAGIGASGITNSIIIEFDTFNNDTPFFDIPQHHITIFKNGFMNQANHVMDVVTQPVCAMPFCDNIDNNVWRPIRIRWEFISATSQRISVFFDNNLRLTSTKNHIQDSFQGSTKVFYSLSSATGAYTNLQQVQISDNSVVNTTCVGTAVTLVAPDLGSNYVWTNGTSTSFTNTFVPTTSGIVSCTYTDFCGVQRTITFNVTVRPEIQIPTITTNSPICDSGDAVFTITGTAGLKVTFALDGVESTVTIPATGSITVTKPNASADVEFKMTRLEDPNCFKIVDISKTIIFSNKPIISPINFN